MPAKKTKGLGRGLDALIPVSVEEIKEEKKIDVNDGSSVLEVSINKVEPNRDQPRKTFREEPLEDLTNSIKEHGVLQPLLVKDRGDYYQIICGERRWRASLNAGLKTIPVIVEDLTEQQIVEVSIIENIQREDLNPIEEALAYKKLLTQFNLTQEQVAERVSKNRTTVANMLRLLNLTEEVQQMLVDGSLSSGHARALLSVGDNDKQISIANRIVDEKLSVRDVEKLVKNLDKPAKPKQVTPEVLKLLCQQFEEGLRTKLGTKVSINIKDEEKGKIEIEYFSKEELESIVQTIME